MNGLLIWFVDAAIFMLGVAVILCAIRLLRGKSIADRAVALDLAVIEVVAIIILYSVRVNDPVYLDAAMIVGLIGFMGTLAFARYIERGAEAK
jgi:multisubunit Na+/H+ antiporter MnhF subunit